MLSTLPPSTFADGLTAFVTTILTIVANDALVITDRPTAASARLDGFALVGWAWGYTAFTVAGLDLTTIIDAVIERADATVH